MASKIKKTGILLSICICMVVSLLASAGRGEAADEPLVPDSEVIIPDSSDTLYDHVKIAESDTHELYFMEDTLSIIVRDKSTGAIMESTMRVDDGTSNKLWRGFMKSGIVLNILEGTNDKAVQADFINTSTTKKITYSVNGFTADVTYPKYGISFQLTVSLEGSEIVVYIPDESIVEENSNYCINTILVYPMMGHSYKDDRDGYMLIPDGNGALIYLNDKEKRISGGFSQMVYSDDIGFVSLTTESLLWDQYQTVNPAQQVIAPIFGMVHTDTEIGYLGIIEEGDMRASIEAYPNGSTVMYNRIYAKFIMRKAYVQPTSNSSSGTVSQIESERSHYNIKVRYCFVGGDDANYTGLAITYRNYLLSDTGLQIKDNSYKTRIDFLGLEKEEWLIFKKNVVMTTTDQIREMYSELKAAGVDGILTLYKGWQKDGLNALPITTYKADSAIGGTKDLTKLINEAAAEGIDFYLYQDALRINPDESNATFNVVKRVNKRRYEESTYMSVYDTFLYLIPRRTEINMTKLARKYTSAGVSNIAIAGISNTIFTFNYAGTYYTREYTAGVYNELLSSLDSDFNMVLESPSAYLWNYTDCFIDMPSGSSDYIFTDEEIPFLSIVLKGIMPMYSEYVNFEANKSDFFLELAEYGIYPSFYITYNDSADLIYTNSADVYSSKYSIYKNEIIEYDEKLGALNEAVMDAFIVDYVRDGNGFNTVTYSNGVVVYVNHTKKPVTVDGIEVAAMSFTYR